MTIPEHTEVRSNALVKGTIPPASAAMQIWTDHHFASALVIKKHHAQHNCVTTATVLKTLHYILAHLME